MKKKNLILVVVSALFSALSAVFVGFIHIPNGIGGYTHIGDAIVYLCASLLPLPYAAASSAIGFALADLIAGYPYYMLPSAIIRVLVVLMFSSKAKKLLTKKNIIALPLSLLITVGGYAVTKFILKYFVESYTSEAAVAAMISSIPGNIIQCVLSSIVFVLVALALDKLNFKEKFDLGDKNV